MEDPGMTDTLLAGFQERREPSVAADSGNIWYIGPWINGAGCGQPEVLQRVFDWQISNRQTIGAVFLRTSCSTTQQIFIFLFGSIKGESKKPRQKKKGKKRFLLA